MAPLRVTAYRIAGALSGSSTRPLVVETSSGRFVVKLVNGPEGPRALAAEYLCAELAALAGVPVLQHAVVDLDPSLARAIGEDELREAVARGAGACFGVRELPRASAVKASLLDGASDDFALPLLWFDVLVQNPDRRRNNPNILAHGASLFAIDHAACLPFHHDFRFSEEAPRTDVAPGPDHVFAHRHARLTDWHPRLVPRLQRERIEQICLSLPREWLGRACFATEDRQRLAYAAYLWKRLTAMTTMFRPSVAHRESPR